MSDLVWVKAADQYAKAVAYPKKSEPPQTNCYLFEAKLEDSTTLPHPTGTALYPVSTYAPFTSPNTFTTFNSGEFMGFSAEQIHTSEPLEANTAGMLSEISAKIRTFSSWAVCNLTACLCTADPDEPVELANLTSMDTRGLEAYYHPEALQTSIKAAKAFMQVLNNSTQDISSNESQPLTHSQLQHAYPVLMYLLNQPDCTSSAILLAICNLDDSALQKLAFTVTSSITTELHKTLHEAANLLKHNDAPSAHRSCASLYDSLDKLNTLRLYVEEMMAERGCTMPVKQTPANEHNPVICSMILYSLDIQLSRHSDHTLHIDALPIEPKLKDSLCAVLNDKLRDIYSLTPHKETDYTKLDLPALFQDAINKSPAWNPITPFGHYPWTMVHKPDSTIQSVHVEPGQNNRIRVYVKAHLANATKLVQAKDPVYEHIEHELDPDNSGQFFFLCFQVDPEKLSDPGKPPIILSAGHGYPFHIKDSADV